ncbi:MAG: ATP-binding protein [Nanoarchaeota archaeon]
MSQQPLEVLVVNRTVGEDLLETVSNNVCDGPLHAVAELVANSWDADAHLVEIEIDKPGNRILIKDDGSGMDRAGIDAFYRTGDSPKKVEKTSPSGRPRLGRYGIAAFATKALANVCELTTIRDRSRFHCREEFGESQLIGKSLEVSVFKAPEREHGTEILLTNLKVADYAEFNQFELRSYLASHFHQIRAENNFVVIVNGESVKSRVIEGAVRFSVDTAGEHTGPIKGTIYLTGRRTKDAGVHIRVDGREIGDSKRLINLEYIKRSTAGRVIVEVQADDMRQYITSRRDGFIPGKALDELKRLIRKELIEVNRYAVQGATATKSRHLRGKRDKVLTNVKAHFKSRQVPEIAEVSLIFESENKQEVPSHLPALYDEKSRRVVLNPNYATLDTDKAQNELSLKLGVVDAVATAIAEFRTRGSGLGQLERFLKHKALLLAQVAPRHKKEEKGSEIFSNAHYELKTLASLSGHSIPHLRHAVSGGLLSVTQSGEVMGIAFKEMIRRVGGLITLYQLIEENVPMKDQAEQLRHGQRFTKVLSLMGDETVTPFFHNLTTNGSPCYFAEPSCAKELADLMAGTDLRKIRDSELPGIMKAHKEQYFSLGDMAERLKMLKGDVAGVLNYVESKGLKIDQRERGRGIQINYADFISALQHKRKAEF